MTALRHLHPREYLALKTAYRTLVEGVGGVDAASAVLAGYAPGRIAEAYSLNRADRMPRLDHVADLEAVAGNPTVTFHLARLAGYTLLPVNPSGGPVGAAMARIAETAGQVMAEAMRALADGSIDPAERAALRSRLAQLGVAVAQAEADRKSVV